MLQQINSRHEMFEFIKSTERHFGSIEDWQDWFGFELKWNEDTGEVLETIDEYINRDGTFDYIPHDDEYPVVIDYVNETSETRVCGLNINIWDWISIKR